MSVDRAPTSPLDVLPAPSAPIITALITDASRRGFAMVTIPGVPRGATFVELLYRRDDDPAETWQRGVLSSSWVDVSWSLRLEPATAYQLAARALNAHGWPGEMSEVVPCVIPDA